MGRGEKVVGGKGEERVGAEEKELGKGEKVVGEEEEEGVG